MAVERSYESTRVLGELAAFGHARIRHQPERTEQSARGLLYNAARDLRQRVRTHRDGDFIIGVIVPGAAPSTPNPPAES